MLSAISFELSDYFYETNILLPKLGRLLTADCRQQFITTQDSALVLD